MNKWKRLEKERKKLKLQVREELSRLQRLQQQLDSVEEKQSSMVAMERKNVEELEKEEALLAIPPDPVIDVLSEQAVVPGSNTDWWSSFVSPGTPSEVPDNSSSA